MREETRKALATHFAAGWAAGGELFPVYFQNQKGLESSAAWGRFSLVYGQNQPSAIGPDFRRCLGMIFLQVFLPTNDGTANATKAADKLEAMFEDQRFEITAAGQTLEIQIETGCDGPREVGLSEGWMQYNVSLDFRVETAR